MAAAAVMELEGVTFAYGAVPIVEGVNLRVEAGEFLGVVGPNAGGKSTLLKLVLGLLAPQSGRIEVMGERPEVARRHLGYVPQHPSFPRDFPITVQQTVLLGRLGARGRGGWLQALAPGRYSREDRAIAQQALAEVEADNVAHRQVGSLSGGQLQRVLLARALASDPAVLLLDEPTANVDQRLEGDIFDLLRRLNERKTIVVVSHDVGFISSYVGRVACVNRTLVCHHTDDIDGEVIRELYKDNVRMVAHHHG